MMSAPGLIGLLGSGETATTGGQMFELLTRPYPPPVKISVLETPAGFEANSARVAGRVADYLASRLQNYRPQISQVAARKKGTQFSPDSAEVVRPLYESQVIFFGPGSPTYTVRQLRDSLAWQVIQARHRLGASLALASAATIAMGTLALPVYEIYKVGEDPHWKPGLDLFRPFGLSLVVVPHWNNREGGAELDTSRCFIGQERFNELFAQVPENVMVLGIDEHTSVIFDFAAGECRVMGQGGAHLLRRAGSGIKQEDCPAGCHFPLKAVGEYQPLEDAGIGISQAVWENAQAMAGVEEAARSPADQSAVPDEIQRLVTARQEARSRSDWAVADRLRGEIEQLGWQVTDTPGGPLVQKR